MTVYAYAVTVTGHTEAPNEEHAALQAKMGVSVTARLLETPNQIAVIVRPLEIEKPKAKKPRRSRKAKR